MHQGNAANFALNALLAEGGELLLRIDDLDRGRFRPEYLSDIFRVVDWLGIKVTEGPLDPDDFEENWSQVHRLPRYGEALDQLRNHPLVYACPCTRKELTEGRHAHNCLSAKHSLDKDGVAWRINTREVPTVIIPDLMAGAAFEISLREAMPDFVIRRKNGVPSYQLACTVDDLDQEVNRIGRGRDLLPSTAAQSLLSDLLGFAPLFDRAQFVHHPLVLSGEGGKLSKSAGASGVAGLEDENSVQEIIKIARSWLMK